MFVIFLKLIIHDKEHLPNAVTETFWHLVMPLLHSVSDHPTLEPRAICPL